MISFLREMIIAGGKYLEIKASLHLFHESILFLGKDKNQALARSPSENGNSLSLTISLPLQRVYCTKIEQYRYHQL